MFRKHARLQLTIAVIALLAVLGAAGCGSTAAPSPSPSASSKPAQQSAAPASSPAASAAKVPTTVAELAVYKGSDRQQILEAGAQKEGTLNWYTSNVGAILDAMTGAYKKKYPFVKVEVFRADSTQLATKVTQEVQAGQQVFDTLQTSPQTISLLFDAKVTTPYYSPGLANVPSQLKVGATADGIVNYATARVSHVGFGYNTSLIPESVVPKTFQDLLNPALTGKLSVAGSNTGERWLGAVLQGLGEEKGKQFLEELAAKQKITVQQVSGGALLDLIAKGEVPASPTIFREHVEQAAVKGGPVKWVALPPAMTNVSYETLAAKSPHPHAALLWIDFIFSEEGRKIYRENFMSTGSEKESFTLFVPEEGRTSAQAEADTKRRADMFKAIFR